MSEVNAGSTRPAGPNSTFPPYHRATLIVGPQGVGKTLLAIALAAQFGKNHKIVSAEEICNPFALGDILANRPDALIVDEGPIARSQLAKITRLLSGRQITLNVKGKPPREVAAPHFIFCSGESDFLLEDDRRFAVIRIDSQRPALHDFYEEDNA